MKKIKLSQFAKEHSVNYRTAYNWFYKGIRKCLESFEHRGIL
jgi:predicted site-specific integrase-resolvase